MSTTEFPTGTILGYPRIGRRRELKRAVEAFWRGDISETQLREQAAYLRKVTRTRLASLGLDAAYSIPESFSFYDHVLDAAVTVGAVPGRFTDVVAADGSVDLAGYFTIARGEGDRLPVEMTKWFDSNYHYSVPEIGPETNFRLANRDIIDWFKEAAASGVRTRPVIVGPITFLLLSKPSEAAPAGYSPLSRLDDLVSVYAQLLAELRAAGAEWVQLDEPGLVSESVDAERGAVLVEAITRAYGALSAQTDRPLIFVATPYAALDDALPPLAATGVEAIGLDLVRGGLPQGLSNETKAALGTKTLVGGVLNGHNIWREDLGHAFDKLEALRTLSPSVAVSSSTSFLHIPHDVMDEPLLDPRIASWLAFADQKTQQIGVLARGLVEGRTAIAADIAASQAVLADRASAPGVRDGAVRQRLAVISNADRTRAPYAERVAVQTPHFNLPPLPTTTIGSFPQTGDIRRERARFVKGEITEAEYDGFLRDEIARVVKLQEDLGFDVLVHGEAERNDMVQYFAEHLDGFTTTVNGWVQSYGSRATRPSILWGDIARPAPITVEWSKYAQSLTAKPMKGMLTGPVTILAWSFVRDDQTLGETADQVALALRDEISDLEAADIGIIQVDEPALRELLPLKKADQKAYLEWSVGSFLLATAGAAPITQLHTHLCYSEFGVVVDAIRALDADVTSIEAARSKMEIVPDLARSGFDHGVGPGVYDIHSPRVPGEPEIVSLLHTALGGIPADRLWVNPDCGLKTRGYDETVASLRNLVDATREARAAL